MESDDGSLSPLQPGWYYRLGEFFRSHFGSPVYKVPVNAGFSCPNLDGIIGRGGCTYCRNPAFSPVAGEKAEAQDMSIKEQLEMGMKKKTRRERLYLAYFQAYTNTYAPVEKLRSLYDEALRDQRVIGLSVATRPDCIGDDILELLEYYAARCHLWLELGLQSAHNVTLKKINRGHTYEQFRECMEKVRGRNIFTCAHVILGLPGENREMALETMNKLNQCGVDGVKFHHLQVVRGTAMAAEYLAGKVSVFETAGAYIPLLCDCLETLDPHITIHRLAAQAADQNLLLAPRWNESATRIASAVERELKNRGSRQGSRYN